MIVLQLLTELQEQHASDKEKLLSEVIATKKQVENQERAIKGLQTDREALAAERDKYRAEHSSLSLELKKVTSLLFSSSMLILSALLDDR